jgi:hypothetical protein
MRTATSEATPQTTAVAPIGVKLPTARRQIPTMPIAIGTTIRRRSARPTTTPAAVAGSQEAAASIRKASGQPTLAMLSAAVD